jgi:hypothetical protein
MSSIFDIFSLPVYPIGNNKAPVSEFKDSPFGLPTYAQIEEAQNAHEAKVAQQKVDQQLKNDNAAYDSLLQHLIRTFKTQKGPWRISDSFCTGEGYGQSLNKAWTKLSAAMEESNLYKFIPTTIESHCDACGKPNRMTRKIDIHLPEEQPKKADAAHEDHKDNSTTITTEGPHADMIGSDGCVEEDAMAAAGMTN